MVASLSSWSVVGASPKTLFVPNTSQSRRSFTASETAAKNDVRCSFRDGSLFDIRFIVTFFKGVQAVEAGAQILEFQSGTVRRPHARQAFRHNGTPGQASDVRLPRQPCLSFFLPFGDVNR